MLCSLSSDGPLKNQNKLTAAVTELGEAKGKPETGSENRAQCRKFAVAACGVCRKYTSTHIVHLGNTARHRVDGAEGGHNHLVVAYTQKKGNIGHIEKVLFH